MKNIFRDELLLLKNDVRALFTSKLVPNIDRHLFLGIESKIIKKFATNKLSTQNKEVNFFLESLPHKYVDEYLLHIEFINLLKNFNEVIDQIKKLSPFLNSWILTDTINPKIFNKSVPKVEQFALELVQNKQNIYIRRLGLIFLKKYFLGEYFKEKYLEIVANIKSNEYYLNMMIAWYFSEALVKKYELALPYLENKKLDKWTHNKTISKCCDSFRFTLEQKEFLKTLRIK